jgi:hypothetical protein
VDTLLREVWSPHPEFRFVPHTPSFDIKVKNALEQLRAAIGR